MNVGPSSSIAIRIRVSRLKCDSFSPSRFFRKPFTNGTSNRLTQSAKPYLLRIVRILPQRFTLRYTLGMVVIFIKYSPLPLGEGRAEGRTTNKKTPLTSPRRVHLGRPDFSKGDGSRTDPFQF